MLKTITIRNFKSIREQTLALNSLNIFIGANGAGKSNLIQVFRLLRAIVTKNLGNYTEQKGGADKLLHFGRKRSEEMSFTCDFIEGERNSFQYSAILYATDNDKLSLQLSDENRGTQPNFVTISAIRIYHFHDTSDSAPPKLIGDVEDNRFLRPDGGNLAAFLYWMKEKKPDHFAFIQETIRQIAPFFGEFRLEPSRRNDSKIRVEWAEKGSDAYFNASSLSDGTLRFICLATLLLQPDLPPLILLDEPELGLHPAAIQLLAEMLKSSATKTQIIVATQSVTLVNQFTPEDVWAVDRRDGQSVFTPLNTMDMTDWLENYSLGELWEKNLLGARP